MRAPTNRRPAGTHDGPREPSGPQPKPVTAEDLCKTDEFHSRLAEARVKREKALAARMAAAEQVPRRRFTPILSADQFDDMDSDSSADDAAGFAPSPFFLHRPPASRVAAKEGIMVKQADLRAFASSLAPMAPLIPSEIELSEDAAARQRLGAAMTLSAMEDRPLEPALVPMVSPATLAGLRLHQVVPAVLGLGAVVIAAWIAPRLGDETAEVAVTVAQAPQAVIPAPRPVAEQPVTSPESLAAPEVLTASLDTTTLPAPQIDTAPDARAGVPVGPARPIASGPALLAPDALSRPLNLDARNVPGPTEATEPTLAALDNPDGDLTVAVSSPRPKARPETALDVASPVSDGVGLATPINIALRLSDGVNGAEGSEALTNERLQTRATVPSSAAELILTGAQSGASEARPLIMHIPDGPAQQQLSARVAQVNALVTPHVEPRAVPFDISYSHVRVYHAEDMAAAAQMAERLDISVLDKTSFEPRPSPGLIEIWWQGNVAADGVVTRTAQALPQVLDEAQVALETSIVGEDKPGRFALPTRSAWVPAARLTPRAAAGANGDLPITGAVTEGETAEPVVLNAGEPQGLRRLFRGLGASTRRGFGALNREAED